MDDVKKIANQLVAPGKGILAADESTGTIKKRFDKIGIPDTVENHRSYREMLFTAPHIEEFISGVIMFEETLRQSDSTGKPFAQVLSERGIIPGIKVDQGKEEFPGSPKEYITKGLEGLADRLDEYKDLGAKFTKWRSLLVIDVAEKLPSDRAIEENADGLANYAKAVQEAGMVPIVEPEVYMEGTHTMHDSRMATMRVLKRVFEKLSEHSVDFAGMLLKPNWIHPGLSSGVEPQSSDVAENTIAILKETVHTDVPGVVFLSGGDTPEDSTKHLAEIAKYGKSPEGGVPWQISFSFGRALQNDALNTWQGKDENRKAAQKVFLDRARKVSAAREGILEN